MNKENKLSPNNIFNILLGERRSKIGSYSFAVSIIILAILLVINVLACALPENITELDISSSRLYSLSSDSKVVVNNLTRDVDIYWITQSGSEDSVVEKLLGKYDSQSGHIKVTKKNPDIYPTFAEQYTNDVVQNNDLVVVSGDRYRYISIDDIYLADEMSYYYSGSTSYNFDGEGQITSAINYVVAEELPKVYVLEGHGEEDMSDTAVKLFERLNIELGNLSLLEEDIPDDADALLIYAPSTDISDMEASTLENYVDNGGKIFVLSGPSSESTLENLNSLLSYVGINVQEGIVIEGSSTSYMFNMPYVILPEIKDFTFTEELDEGSNVIVSVASGAFAETNDTYTVDTFLSSSNEAFSKIDGYEITTYDYEDGDINGAFSLGAASTAKDGNGQLIWIGTSLLLDDSYDSYSSNANSHLFSGILSNEISDGSQVSIPSKSMSNTYLTFTEGAASKIKMFVVVIIPLVFLIYGIFVTVMRRRFR